MRLSDNSLLFPFFPSSEAYASEAGILLCSVCKPLYEVKPSSYITAIRYKPQPKSLHSRNSWSEALTSVRHPMTEFEKLIVTNFFHVSELSRKPISEIALFFFIRFFFTLPPPLSPPFVRKVGSGASTLVKHHPCSKCLSPLL